MNSMNPEKEHNVIITGANRGVGLALVEKFAANGCNIWACARKPNEEFQSRMRELAAQFKIWIEPVYFDLSDEEAIKSNLMSIFKEKKPIHTLINNAGIRTEKLFQMFTMKEIKEMFNTNVFALMYLTQLVLKIMGRQKYGNIINIASIAGLTPYSGNACYGGTKAAVILFTEILAIEAAALGNIRVNAIAPGHTDTDMAKNLTGKSLEKGLSNSVMKRLAQPSEIANVAYFLASDEASFINGQVIRVDGGASNGS